MMRYIPSPIPIRYAYVYSAIANKSGRMQYHKIKPGISRLRISRNEFIKVYNEAQILAVRPLRQAGTEAVFQMEFYV